MSAYAVYPRVAYSAEHRLDRVQREEITAVAVRRHLPPRHLPWPHRRERALEVRVVERRDAQPLVRRHGPALAVAALVRGGRRRACWCQPRGSRAHGGAPPAAFIASRSSHSVDQCCCGCARAPLAAVGRAARSARDGRRRRARVPARRSLPRARPPARAEPGLSESAERSQLTHRSTVTTPRRPWPRAPSPDQQRSASRPPAAVWPRRRRRRSRARRRPRRRCRSRGGGRAARRPSRARAATTRAGQTLRVTLSPRMSTRPRRQPSARGTTRTAARRRAAARRTARSAPRPSNSPTAARRETKARGRRASGGEKRPREKVLQFPSCPSSRPRPVREPGSQLGRGRWSMSRRSRQTPPRESSSLSRARLH